MGRLSTTECTYLPTCCVPGFHNASLINATSGPSGMLRSNAGHARQLH